MNDIKIKLREMFWVTQNKKWLRAIDAFLPIINLFVALIIIYFISGYSESEPDKALIHIFSWLYVLASPVLSVILYRESDLRKIERLAITIFILVSMSILSLFFVKVMA